MNLQTHQLRAGRLPIVFVDRKVGQSKMFKPSSEGTPCGHIFECAWTACFPPVNPPATGSALVAVSPAETKGDNADHMM